MPQTTFQENPQIQRNRWRILIAIGLFTFMSTLDGSILNIAIPTILEDFGNPMNQVEWVVSIYLMTICSCLLFFGKVGDVKGKISVFKLGTIIFVLGSFLCGIRVNLAFLLFGRFVQALGASMTMATNSGIITEVFPLKERGVALGWIGSFVSLGSIAGPALGGLILAQFSWSYIFWINVPVGLATIALGWKVLPKDVSKSQQPLDYPGFISFTAMILGVFGGIFIGQEQGFLAFWPLVLFVCGFISGGLFLWLEQRAEHPLVRFHLFRNQAFTLSLITALLIFVANFFSNVLMPFYLQSTRGESARTTGLIMMVLPLIMIVSAPLSGRLVGKYGAMKLSLIGLIFISLGQLGYVFLGQSSSLIFLLLALACVGLGNGLFQAPNNTLIMGSVERSELGVAGSLNSLARNMGMVLGISFATSILYEAMTLKAGTRVTTYPEGRPELFLFGLHATYAIAALVGFVALSLTIYRFIQAKKQM